MRAPVIRAIPIATLLTIAAVARAADNPLARFATVSGADCADASHIIAEATPSPANSLYMRVQHIGDAGTAELAEEVAHSVAWDVGVLSGFDVLDRAASQRGYVEASVSDPASAFQLECGDAGFVIDTWRFSHAQPLFGEGPSVSIGRDLVPAIPAFPAPGWRLRIEARIAVPWIANQATPASDGTAQVSFFYYGVDTKSGTDFAHLVALFENRAPGVDGSGIEATGNDGVTPFVTTPLLATDASGAPVRFARVGRGSDTMHFVSGWPDARLFAAEIDDDAFSDLLATLRASGAPQLSPDPADYRIIFFGVLGEVFPGTSDQHNVAIGGSVRDLTLSRIPPRTMHR